MVEELELDFTLGEYVEITLYMKDGSKDCVSPLEKLWKENSFLNCKNPYHTYSYALETISGYKLRYCEEYDGLLDEENGHVGGSN